MKSHSNAFFDKLHADTDGMRRKFSTDEQRIEARAEAKHGHV